MQHNFTNHVLALAQLQGGRDTPAPDCTYHPSENLPSIFKSHEFHPYEMPKHLLPLSPASTASDHSDHSDHSIVSEHSSQSELSDSSNSPSTNFKETTQHDYVNGYDHSQSSCSSSSLPTKVQPNGLAGFQRGNPAEDFIRLQGSNSNNNNNNINNINSREVPKHGIDPSRTWDSTSCRPSDVKNNFTPSHQVSYVQDSSQTEASWLPYRTRPDTISEPCKTHAYSDIQSTTTELNLKPETPSSLNGEHSSSDCSAPSKNSRCFPGLLNPLTGFTSSRSTPVESPQNAQINARRRPVNSALPPPKLRRDTDNTDAIVRMIVIFCTNLIQSIWPTDSASGSSNCPTTSQPGGNVLPLQVFITETLRRSKTSYSTLQIALFYLILLKQCLPELANPNQSGQSGCRAMLCGRRMFLTALILASKYLQDRNYSARAWSKISGLPMKEINDNERRYLRFVGWDLHVPKEAFENWSKIVLAICRSSTGQEYHGQDSQQQPPPPGPNPGFISQPTRKDQLQDMCVEDQMYAVRSWWIFNLQALRTDVVRCPRRTEKYVLSIPPLKSTPSLPRPLFETTSMVSSFGKTCEQDVLPTMHKLSRPPSMDCIENTPNQVTGSQIPGTSKIMPPPPPMLGNLPTPQTTPRSEMTNTWNPSPLTSGSRCRDSATFLRGLDRTCPMANIEKFPVSKVSLPPPTSLHPRKRLQESSSATPQPSPSAWLQYSQRIREQVQTPNGSLTSSPESITSDLSSLSGFVGRSRTSSFSSTSSRSTMSLLNTLASDPERCEGFKRQLNSLDAQIAPRVRDWRNTSPEGRNTCHTPQGPQGISRPQTAFRTSTLRPNCVEELAKTSKAGSEAVSDEGYWSGDHAQEKLEEENRQVAACALLDMQIRSECEEAMGALRSHENTRPMLSRPGIQRSVTQVYAPLTRTNTSYQQTLKRSRSESFDNGTEQCLSEPSTCQASYAQRRNVQQSWQPWAGSKQPVLCGTQEKNKRIAVQSAAATRAGTDLRREACARYNYYKAMSGSVESVQPETTCTGRGSWQLNAPQVHEIHV